VIWSLYSLSGCQSQLEVGEFFLCVDALLTRDSQPSSAATTKPRSRPSECLPMLRGECGEGRGVGGGHAVMSCLHPPQRLALLTCPAITRDG
jgi:hypothetical protein